MKVDFNQVDWSLRTNIYEVNVRQYSEKGNLAGFREHMPRLADMGIETLWFMPLTPISVKNRKGSLGSYYACSSYVEINEEFGPAAEFREIVKYAHDLGMKVIVDWVANHTGCDHEWTLEHPDFYKRDNSGNFYDSHGWDDVIDLDYNNQEMRLEMIRSMRFWLQEFNLDGFRCDMAMLTPLDFWLQARLALEENHKLFWLAELDPLDNPDYVQVFDAAYTWRWMNTTKQCADQGALHIHDMRAVLDLYGESRFNAFCPAWFTSNHDENSWNGTEEEKYGEMAIPLAVFSATWKGVPLLYSGQELPNLKRLAFFDHDPIDWSRPSYRHDFYKQLLGLRRRNDAFCMSDEASACCLTWNSVDHHVLTFFRKGQSGTAFIAINFSPWTLDHVEVDTALFAGLYEDAFIGGTRHFNAENKVIQLQPWGYQVWLK